MKQISGRVMFEWCIVLIDIALAAIAAVYVFEGNGHEALSYASSFLALTVAYVAWKWARRRLARSNGVHRP